MVGGELRDVFRSPIHQSFSSNQSGVYMLGVSELPPSSEWGVLLSAELLKDTHMLQILSWSLQEAQDHCSNY